MGVIVDFNKLSVTRGNHIQYEDRPIGKWWGKTLYHFDPKENTLHYENFSLIGLFLHYVFGYKKDFNTHGLKDSVARNFNVKLLLKSNDEVTEKTAMEALRVFTTKKNHLGLGWFCAPESSIIQLFKEGLTPNVEDSDGASALHLACRYGKVKVAKYLIKHGANVNTRTHQGSGHVAKTPLQEVIQQQNEELFQLLLSEGADVNTLDCYGETILYQAIAKLDTSNPQKNDLAKRMIREIINRVDNVNTTSDRTGQSPLYKACEKGDLEVVNWLLAVKNIDVNAARIYSKPPLFAAIAQGNVAVVSALLDAGANPRPEKPAEETLNDEWDTPLMVAVEDRQYLGKQTDPEMITLLYGAGANINQRGGYWLNTPLHIAANNGDLATVKLLVALRADPSITNRENRTAEAVAHSKGEDEIVSFLKSLPVPV